MCGADTYENAWTINGLVPAKWIKAGVLEDGVVTVGKAREIEGPVCRARIGCGGPPLDGRTRSGRQSRDTPHAQRAGVQKAPRLEVAGIGHALAARAMESLISNGCA